MKKPPKLVWRVSPPAHGPYRSFQKRGWPDATIDNKCAVALYCDDAYAPAKVRVGDHRPITINVADWRSRGQGAAAFIWRTLKQRAVNLAEAREIAAKFFTDHPEYLDRTVAAPIQRETSRRREKKE